MAGKRMTFGKENKVATNSFEFPKLKLKNGERARILAGLEDPLGAYQHTLQKPVVVNGEALMVEAEKRNGEKYKTNKMEWVSTVLCIGDEATLDDKGSDPKNCPVCKLAKDHPDMAKPPVIRFAMHVIRYRTKGTDFSVLRPFSVELLVWSFSARMFNILSDLKEEFSDLRKHDLLLGPCENEGFQKFDVHAGNKAEWLSSAENKALVAETFKENQIKDLTVACGMSKSKSMLEDDVNTVIAAWNSANGADEEDEDSAGLSEELDDLLSGTDDDEVDAGGTDVSMDDLAVDDEATVDEDSVDEESADELDALLNGAAEAEAEPEPAPAAKAKTTRKPAAAKTTAPEEKPAPAPASEDDFNDLLAGLED